MNKKTYVVPTTAEIRINVTSQILSGSVTGKANGVSIGYGGNGNGVEAGASGFFDNGGDESW